MWSYVRQSAQVQADMREMPHHERARRRTGRNGSRAPYSAIKEIQRYVAGEIAYPRKAVAILRKRLERWNLRHVKQVKLSEYMESLLQCRKG